jgi:hypothetical protein
MPELLQHYLDNIGGAYDNSLQFKEIVNIGSAIYQTKDAEL